MRADVPSFYRTLPLCSYSRPYEVMSSSSSVEFFISEHQEEVKKQITDEHIEEISHSMCSQWESLPAYLDLPPIIVQDINRSSTATTEREKRKIFFTTWKDEQGSGATYEKLISALLKIRCRQDAESIIKLCRLLTNTPRHEDTHEQQHSIRQASSVSPASDPGIVFWHYNIRRSPPKYARSGSYIFFWSGPRSQGNYGSL